MPNDLNLRFSQRISVSIVFILGFLATYLAFHRGATFLVPLFTTVFIMLSYYWLECSRRNHRLISSLMVTALGAIAFFAYRSGVGFLFPMVLLSWTALFIRHRYSRPLSTWNKITGVVIGGYCLLLIAFVWLYLPPHPVGYAFITGMALLLALNYQFYLFLAGQKGRLFALTAIPFHLLYFVSSGLAFMLTLVRHRLGKLEAPVALPADEVKPGR
jgi:hypothetical protein